MSYNGWTNYETWNVALWLDNDEHLQDWLVGIATGDLYGDSDIEKADYLQEWVREKAFDFVDENSGFWVSMYGDILTANLQSVNYLEIIRNAQEE